MNLTRLSRKLRNTPTEAEYRLWFHLRGRKLAGLKFRRQVPIGSYIVDFLCFEKRLVIELDGGQHGEETCMKLDRKRSDFIKAQGFLILRFWNDQVFKNIEGVLETILSVAYPNGTDQTPSPNPLPEGRGINGGIAASTPLPEGGDQGEGL